MTLGAPRSTLAWVVCPPPKAMLVASNPMTSNATREKPFLLDIVRSLFSLAQSTSVLRACHQAASQQASNLRLRTQ